MGKSNKEIPDEVRAFFSKIGTKSGNKIKQEVASGKRDPNYYSNISKMRKVHGRQKLQEDTPLDK